MISLAELKTAFKNNKGKFLVLILYILGVFISPLQFFTPSAQNELQSITASLAPTDADSSFRADFSLLKQGKVNDLYSRFVPDGLEPAATSSLQTLSMYFASSTDQMQIVGGRYNKTTTQDSSIATYDIVYQIENNDPTNKYLFAEIQAQDTGSGIQLTDLSVHYSTKSAKELGEFNFASQWVYLLLALLIPLFIVYTALRYLVKAQKPRWPLFLVILFLTVYLELSGDKFGLHAGINGFMTKTGEWGPWAFATPAPLGAIFYYIVRKKRETTQIDENH